MLAVFTGFVLLLAACGGSGKTSNTTAAPPKKLSVVVTTTQLADWVNVLTGGEVDVYSLSKAGDDPHTYTLTSADQSAISSADLIIKNGAGLEPWFDRKIDSINHNANVVDASAGVKINTSADTNAPSGDPHIWMSVANAKRMVSNVGDALAALDPVDKAGYDSALRAYQAQLDALVNSATLALSSLTNKFLVTDHEAYDYLCEEFQLQCVAAVTPVSGVSASTSTTTSTSSTSIPVSATNGVSTTTTSTTPLPSAAQIQSVANSLKNQNIVAVFAEADGNPATAEALATDLGVKVVEGNNGLYADSLGATGGDADSYLKMMNHDVSTIVSNLR